MWKNRGLFQKIFLNTLCCVFLALTVSYGVFVYYEYRNSINENMLESIELSEKLNDALQDYIGNIEGAVITCYYEVYKDPDGALASLLTSNEQMSVSEKITMENELEDFFSKLFLMNHDFVSVYIYSDEDTMFAYSPMAANVLNYSPEQSEWFQQTLEKNGKTHIQINYLPEHTKYNKSVIGFSRMIKSIGNDGIKDNTVILLDFSMKNLESILEKYMLNDMTAVLFANDSGEIIYKSGIDLEISNIKELDIEPNSSNPTIRRIEDDGYCIIKNDEKIYDWNIYYVTNQEYLFEKMEDYLMFMLVILIVLVLIVAVIDYFIVHNMYKPIRDLKLGMKLVKTGNFDVHLIQNSNDELGQLVEDFNGMAYEIKKLIKEKYEEELEKKDAQYQFLQAQIDPHFIFNTLQIISSMAIVNKNMEIEKVSNSLARLIRFSILGEQKLIRLSDEVKNVNSYLEIQKIRFKNRLSFEINFEKGLEEIYIIKLILQPIVENAISHGIELNGKQGIIKINIYEEKERIYLIVSDNGKGMSQQEVNMLMSRINLPLSENEDQHIKTEQEIRVKGNNVGLRNINLRLKMYYGDEYGLSIKSQVGEGTTVTVCIRPERKI